MNKIYLDQASTSFPKAPSVAQTVYDYLSGSAVNVNRGGYRAAYSVAVSYTHLYRGRRMISTIPMIRRIVTGQL